MIIKEDFTKGKIANYKIILWGFYWSWIILLLLPTALLYWIWSGGRRIILTVYIAWIVINCIRYILAKLKFNADFKKAEALVYEGTFIDFKIIATQHFLRKKTKG